MEMKPSWLGIPLKSAPEDAAMDAQMNALNRGGYSPWMGVPYAMPGSY